MIGEKVKIQPIKGYAVLIPDEQGKKVPATRDDGTIVSFTTKYAADQWRDLYAPTGAVAYYETGDEAVVVAEVSC